MNVRLVLALSDARLVARVVFYEGEEQVIRAFLALALRVQVLPVPVERKDLHSLTCMDLGGQFLALASEALVVVPLLEFLCLGRVPMRDASARWAELPPHLAERLRGQARAFSVAAGRQTATVRCGVAP